MYCFKNIGVVLNLEHSNANVLAHAREIVKTNQAKVHLLCLLPHVIDTHQRKAVEKSLKEKVDFDFSLSFISGKPIVEIIHYIAEKKLDAILIEADKEKNKANRFFQGPLPLSLMRRAPCPVWVVKKPITETYQRIMIAVDPEKEEEEKSELHLNDKLIQIGTSYAKQQSAECYLVTAWTLQGESMLEGPFINTPAAEVQKLKDEQKGICARAFERLEKRNRESLVGCQTHMLHGNPGDVIPKFTVENNIDLIVMGTVARAGIQGFLIGNTAETIINQINCSIIAIKPDGFVSPILS